MRRLLLVLLVMSFSVAPAAALAQAASNAAEGVETVSTTTTLNVVDPPPTADPADEPIDDDPAVDIDRSPIEASGNALLKLFVLAVILESALALLFNWRPIVARYDGRGIKAPVSFAAALALVFIFKPDAIAALMSGYGSDVGQGGLFFARVIEAMVIAGGSAGVNRLLLALGFRSQTRAEEVVAKPRWTNISSRPVSAA